MRICIHEIGIEKIDEIKSIINKCLTESGINDVEFEYDNSYDFNENEDLMTPNFFFRRR